MLNGNNWKDWTGFFKSLLENIKKRSPHKTLNSCISVCDVGLISREETSHTDRSTWFSSENHQQPHMCMFECALPHVYQVKLDSVSMIFPGSITCSMSFVPQCGREILLTLEKSCCNSTHLHHSQGHVCTHVCTLCVTLQGMRVLVDARDKLGISWQSCENEKQGMLVMSWEGRVGGSGVEPSEFQLYVMALNALWADNGIQEAYARRSEFQLVSTFTHNIQFSSFYFPWSRFKVVWRTFHRVIVISVSR